MDPEEYDKLLNGALRLSNNNQCNYNNYYNKWGVVGGRSHNEDKYAINYDIN